MGVGYGCGLNRLGFLVGVIRVMDERNLIESGQIRQLFDGFLVDNVNILGKEAVLASSDYDRDKTFCHVLNDKL